MIAKSTFGVLSLMAASASACYNSYASAFRCDGFPCYSSYDCNSNFCENGLCEADTSSGLWWLYEVVFPILFFFFCILGIVARQKRRQRYRQMYENQLLLAQ